MLETAPARRLRASEACGQTLLTGGVSPRGGRAASMLVGQSQKRSPIHLQARRRHLRSSRCVFEARRSRPPAASPRPGGGGASIMVSWQSQERKPHPCASLETSSLVKLVRGQGSALEATSSSPAARWRRSRHDGLLAVIKQGRPQPASEQRSPPAGLLTSRDQGRP